MFERSFAQQKIKSKKKLHSSRYGCFIELEKLLHDRGTFFSVFNVSWSCPFNGLLMGPLTLSVCLTAELFTGVYQFFYTYRKYTYTNVAMFICLKTLIRLTTGF